MAQRGTRRPHVSTRSHGRRATASAREMLGVLPYPSEYKSYIYKGEHSYPATEIILPDNLSKGLANGEPVILNCTKLRFANDEVLWGSLNKACCPSAPLCSRSSKLTQKS